MELRVEENGGVDDLLGEDEDVEGGGEVGLVGGLGQLQEVLQRGGGEVAGGDRALHLGRGEQEQERAGLTWKMTSTRM